MHACNLTDRAPEIGLALGAQIIAVLCLADLVFHRVAHNDQCLMYLAHVFLELASYPLTRMDELLQMVLLVFSICL